MRGESMRNDLNLKRLKRREEYDLSLLRLRRSEGMRA
jgi:hypothetical protein